MICVLVSEVSRVPRKPELVVQPIDVRYSLRI